MGGSSRTLGQGKGVSVEKPDRGESSLPLVMPEKFDTCKESPHSALSASLTITSSTTVPRGEQGLQKTKNSTK
ncbi:hypothetical protein Tco_0415435 [Tanacetum coccineum]